MTISKANLVTGSTTSAHLGRAICATVVEEDEGAEFEEVVVRDLREKESRHGALEKRQGSVNNLRKPTFKILSKGQQQKERPYPV